jgi:chromosome segregation ATPase
MLTSVWLYKEASSNREAALRSEVGHDLSSYLPPITDIKQLETVRKQAAAIPSLKSKLDALTRIHDSSKKKRDTEIARLEEEIDELSKSKGAAEEERKRATEAEKERTRLKGLVDLEKDKATKLEQELAQVKQDAEQTTSGLRDELDSHVEQARTLVAAISSASRSLIPTSPSSQSVDHLALQFQVSRLERKLADRASQVDELVSVVGMLEEEKAFLSDSLDELERNKSHDPDRLIEASLRQDLEESKAFADELRGECERLAQESKLETQWRLCLQSDSEARLEMARAEHELMLAQLEAMRPFEARAKELEQELERTRGEAQASTAAMKAVQDDLAAKIAEIEGRREEVEQLQADVEALAFEKTELDSELGREKERNRKLASALGQSRAAESALADDLAR